VKTATNFDKRLIKRNGMFVPGYEKYLSFLKCQKCGTRGKCQRCGEELTGPQRYHCIPCSDYVRRTECRIDGDYLYDGHATHNWNLNAG
jgi:hypothetical protein